MAHVRKLDNMVDSDCDQVACVTNELLPRIAGAKVNTYDAWGVGATGFIITQTSYDARIRVAATDAAP